MRFSVLEVNGILEFCALRAWAFPTRLSKLSRLLKEAGLCRHTITCLGCKCLAHSVYVFFSSCKTAVHSQLWEPRWEIVTFSQKEKFSFETGNFTDRKSMGSTSFIFYLFS